jgi:hypothetical protein
MERQHQGTVIYMKSEKCISECYTWKEQSMMQKEIRDGGDTGRGGTEER